MTLQNLISISDRSLFMCLTNKKDDSTYERYDFASNIWTKAKLNDRNVITVDQFIRSSLFKRFRKSKLETFSIMRGSGTKIEWLKSNKLFCITISIQEKVRPVFKSSNLNNT